MMRPNILLLYSDQHHAGVLGAEGHPDAKTPNLDRMAREGVRFSRAYCQNAVCGPSRASMMTGLYPRTIGVLDNGDAPPKGSVHVPLPTYLRQEGYQVVCYGKQHMLPALQVEWDEAFSTLPGESPVSYWEWIQERGLFYEFLRDWMAEFGDRMPGVPFNCSAPLMARLSSLPRDATMEAYTAQKTIEFLESAKSKEKPFFCWTSFYRPHQPYTPIRQYAETYPPEKIALPGSLREPAENLPPLLQAWRKSERRPVNLAEAARDEGIYRDYIAYYYALVTEIDHHVGTIMEALEAEGLAENTLVIYTSDHGDFVGHHGMVEKCYQGHSVYEDTLRVPLIFYWKGRILAGREPADLVELVDIYPTLIELCGLQPPASVRLAGRSLVPALTEGERVGRPYAIVENYSQICAITHRYRLGHWIEPPMAGRDFRGFGDMLFDRITDPLEMNNLSGRNEYAEVEKQLRAYLEEWERATPAAKKST